ncbi:MAG: WD40 repeat domain-containing protein [Candidatus Poribacteria bacterium]|nr:WD40 repeat domain-containing protein [Candidatus Poribacteria bacterium]
MRYIIGILIFILSLFTMDGYAQEYTTWGLPDGAKARFGKGEITTIAFSPDGSVLAVASSVGIWIYDAQTSKELALLPVHKDKDTTILNYGIAGNATVNSLVFSPDSKLLAIAGWDGTIRLFDLTNYSERYTLYKNKKTRPRGLAEKPAISLAFSEDGKTLTSLEKTDLHSMKVWDVNSGKLLSDMSGRITDDIPTEKDLIHSSKQGNPTPQLESKQDNPLLAFAISPDGITYAARRLKITDVNKIRETEIAFGNVHTGELEPPLIKIRAMPSNMVTNQSTDSLLPFREIIFSPDGTILAGVEINNSRERKNFKRIRYTKIRFWYVSTGREISTVIPQESEVNPYFPILVFSPDSRTFITFDRGTPIQLWDVSTGNLISTITIPVPKLADPWSIGKIIKLTLHRIGVVRDSAPEKIANISTLAFHPDGKTIAIATDGNENGGNCSLQLWNVANGKLRSTFTEHPKLFSIATNATNFLYLKGRDNLELRETNTGKMLQDITPIWLQIRKKMSDMESRAVSSVNSLFAIGGRDGLIELWNGKTTKRMLTFKGHTGKIKALAFSTDESVLASGSDDMSIRLWNTRSGNQLLKLTDHVKSGKKQNFSNAPTLKSAELVNNLVLSTDGKYLAASSEIGTVWLWELSTPTLLTTITSHEETADVLMTGTGLSKIGMAFSPDNKLFASGGMNGEILLSDVSPNPVSLPLRKHSLSVNTFAFSPDSKLLASGSRDTTIRLWNTETGLEITTLSEHNGEILSLGFSSDGKTLVSGSTDGTILLWDRDKIVALDK